MAPINKGEVPNMKIRHAAALALTGWYLMVPPPKLDPLTRLPTTEPNFDAPLNLWTTFEIFDSAQQCTTGKMNAPAQNQRLLDEFKSSESKEQQEIRAREIERKFNQPKGRFDASAKYERLRPSFAECIASDDPRLRP
jgi:hypothetical protein